jgi:hypothetical protein
MQSALDAQLPEEMQGQARVVYTPELDALYDVAKFTDQDSEVWREASPDDPPPLAWVKVHFTTMFPDYPQLIVDLGRSVMAVVTGESSHIRSAPPVKDEGRASRRTRSVEHHTLIVDLRQQLKALDAQWEYSDSRTLDRLIARMEVNFDSLRELHERRGARL